MVATRPAITFAGEPSNEIQSPSLTVWPSTLTRARLVVHFERARAADADLAHLPADDGGVRRHAAGRGEDPLRHEHAVDVVRQRLDADEDHLLLPFGRSTA